jgi:hypothetical protein
MESRLVDLVTGVKESLEREIRTGFDAVKSRFDVQAARLDRQATENVDVASSATVLSSRRTWHPTNPVSARRNPHPRTT